MFDVEFQHYLIRLRLTRTVKFHFNHGGVLMGLLCRAIGTHDLPTGMMPFACESGRVEFGRGDLYNFGLTLAGSARSITDEARLREALSRIGGQTFESDGARPTLAGNFEVAAVEPLLPPDLSGEAEHLRGVDQLTLRFLSPLRSASSAWKPSKAGALAFSIRTVFPRRFS
jgi:hypothetical protein